MTSLYSVSKYYSTNNIVANMQWISDISPSPSWCCDWVACRLSPLWWKCFFSRVVFSLYPQLPACLKFPVRALWDVLQGMHVCVYFPVHCILFDLRSCVCPQELIPLILCTACLHPEPKERDQLLHILFNLIKRPDDEQRCVCIWASAHV